MRLHRLHLLVATIVLSAVSCGGGGEPTIPPLPPVSAVEITPNSASLTVGQTSQLSVSLKDPSGTILSGRSLAWSSANAAVASVSTTGLVTGLASGTTTISVTSEGRTGSASVTVLPMPVSTVVVSPSTGSVQAGQTVQLTATLSDANGGVLSGRTIAWTSANPAVATVSATGLVSTVAPGAVTISATSEGKSGSAQITVVPVPVASVTVSPTTASIQTSQTVQLSAALLDANGNAPTGRTVTWSTSNANIASVNASGLVTGVAAGSATITAASEGKTGTSQVTVTLPPVAKVTITPSTALLAPAQSTQLTATLTDANDRVITGPAVTWSTSNSAVATVSSSGLVTGVASGSATVTATSQGVSATATITIPPATTIVVTNRLVEDVQVSANGVVLGTVSAGLTQQSTVYVTSLVLTYDLIRPRTSSGVPVGEAMSGIYQTIDNPSGPINFIVNNQLGTQYYFAPAITNNSAYPLLMAVNWGLVDENRCNCTVPAYASNVKLGYYKLYSNTEVRGYSSANGYGVGSYVYWNGFQGSVASGSGSVSLTNTLSIFNLIDAGTKGLLAPSAPLSLKIPQAVKGPVYDHAMPRK